MLKHCVWNLGILRKFYVKRDKKRKKWVDLTKGEICDIMYW